MRLGPKRSTDDARRPWWATIVRPRARRAPLPVGELFISSTGCFVGVDEALADACLAGTVVDDLLWRISLEEWHARRPERRWARSRRAWLQEYDDLCAERVRITAVAQYYGAGEPRRR